MVDRMSVGLDSNEYEIISLHPCCMHNLNFIRTQGCFFFFFQVYLLVKCVNFSSGFEMTFKRGELEQEEGTQRLGVKGDWFHWRLLCKGPGLL